MTSRLWQWLVFFFTRPIRVSDLSALARRMKPRARPAPLPEVAAAAIDTVPSMPAPARPRKSAGSATARAAGAPSIVSSMFKPELEVGVSEQPLDTLPAELRDELQRPSTGRLQGSGARDA